MVFPYYSLNSETSLTGVPCSERQTDRKTGVETSVKQRHLLKKRKKSRKKQLPASDHSQLWSSINCRSVTTCRNMQGVTSHTPSLSLSLLMLGEINCMFLVLYMCWLQPRSLVIEEPAPYVWRGRWIATALPPDRDRVWKKRGLTHSLARTFSLLSISLIIYRAETSQLLN